MADGKHSYYICLCLRLDSEPRSQMNCPTMCTVFFLPDMTDLASNNKSCQLLLLITFTERCRFWHGAPRAHGLDECVPVNVILTSHIVSIVSQGVLLSLYRTFYFLLFRKVSPIRVGTNVIVVPIQAGCLLESSPQVPTRRRGEVRFPSVRMFMFIFTFTAFWQMLFIQNDFHNSFTVSVSEYILIPVH